MLKDQNYLYSSLVVWGDIDHKQEGLHTNERLYAW